MSDDAARNAAFRDFGIIIPTEETYRGASTVERFRKEPDSFTPEQREMMQPLVDEIDRLLACVRKNLGDLQASEALNRCIERDKRAQFDMIAKRDCSRATIKPSTKEKPDG